MIILLEMLTIVQLFQRMNKQWLQKLKPEIPTAFPANQGIRIEETTGADDIKVKIFSNRVGDNSVFFSGPKML